MRVRHRIPSIFNLSMVDVLCCALGCIILLWLVNARAARRQTDELSDSRQALDRARGELTTTNDQLESARSRLVYLASTEQERDDTKRRLASVRGDLADLQRQRNALRGQLAAAKDDADSMRGQLARTQADVRSTASQRDAVREMLAEKEKAVRSLSNDLNAVKDRAGRLQEQADLVAGLREKLAEQEARAKRLEKQVAQSSGALDETQTDLEKARQDADRTRKDLQAANRTIEELQGDKKVLRAETDRIRAATDNRFAGIQLTGKRVVFLVDMSGSMELVDEHTSAPAKWRGVRESVAKVMRSLPELQKFQVVIFSDRVRYLLGNAGQWLDYDAKTSADRVVDALAKIKPEGGTNMYAGMEAAFRFRAEGLDTIYFLSDGLPNLGPDLTPEQSRLGEVERGEILGKYIRRLLKTDWNRERTNSPRVRINTIGFFYESPDVGAFLWALARENDGSFVGMSRP